MESGSCKLLSYISVKGNHENFSRLSEKSGYFYIQQQIVEPPLSLADQVFPEISDWWVVHGIEREIWNQT